MVARLDQLLGVAMLRLLPLSLLLPMDVLQLSRMVLMRTV